MSTELQTVRNNEVKNLFLSLNKARPRWRKGCNARCIKTTIKDCHKKNAVKIDYRAQAQISFLIDLGHPTLPSPWNLKQRLGT